MANIVISVFRVVVTVVTFRYEYYPVGARSGDRFVNRDMKAGVVVAGYKVTVDFFRAVAHELTIIIDNVGSKLPIVGTRIELGVYIAEIKAIVAQQHVVFARRIVELEFCFLGVVGQVAPDKAVGRLES